MVLVRFSHVSVYYLFDILLKCRLLQHRLYITDLKSQATVMVDLSKMSLLTPTGVTVDNSGNLLIASNGEIHSFSGAGAYLGRVARSVNAFVAHSKCFCGSDILVVLQGG